MKVFWSWQSDHDGRIGRHFVRDALIDAIEALKRSPEIEEAKRDDAADIHLDHDRKGVPGSPDLAPTILEKIDASAVFVADVTPIGSSPSGRKIMNPNVAIELGYALKALTSTSVLMVMNEAFGDRSDLPFDLRHKAGPISYRLEPTSTKDEIRAAQSKLTSELKLALAPYLSMPAKAVIEDRSWELKEGKSPASFVNPQEILCLYQEDRFEPEKPAKRMVWAGNPAWFLRLIPTGRPKRLKRALLFRTIEQVSNRPPPFGRGISSDFCPNDWGVICFSRYGGYDSEVVGAYTQVSEYGELWGADHGSLARRRDKDLIPWFEGLYESHLSAYLRFAIQTLSLSPPFRISAGMCGTKGYQLLLPQRPGYIYPDGNIGPPCLVSQVVWHGQLDDPSLVRKALMPFFLEMWDAFGLERFEWLSETDAVT